MMEAGRKRIIVNWLTQHKKVICLYGGDFTVLREQLEACGLLPFLIFDISSISVCC
jgi:hypothetical protein